MIDTKYFLTTSGKLNTNWRNLIKKDPSKFDRSSYRDDLDDRTVLNLAIRGLTELPKCKVCGEYSKIDAVYCSRKCSANDPEVKAKQFASTDTDAKSKKASASLKGRNDYHAKTWETRRKKYGSGGFSSSGLDAIQNSDKNVSKAKATCIERYGVHNGSMGVSARHKLSKARTTNPTSQAHLPEWIFDKGQFITRFKENGSKSILIESGCSESFFNRLCVDYGLREKKETLAEVEICNFLDSLGVEYIKRSRKIIPPFEVDIYVPAAMLAIEYDGIYWHSSGSVQDDIKFKTQHVNKTNLCEAQGIHLIHIFEDEWQSALKRNIWKSIISHKLGKSTKIHARKCEVKVIDKDVANAFCAVNHLQGSNGHSLAVGLFHNNELMQVATFGVPRYDKTREFELIRLCSKLNVCIVGGASKLLKGKSFVSYANRRWSFGNVYDSVGLEKVRLTPPNYFYVVDGVLKHRSGFMKHTLASKLETFDPLKTEHENCYANGLRRIWDCGNILYRTK